MRSLDIFTFYGKLLHYWNYQLAYQNMKQKLFQKQFLWWGSNWNTLIATILSTIFYILWKTFALLNYSIFCFQPWSTERTSRTLSPRWKSHFTSAMAKFSRCQRFPRCLMCPRKPWVCVLKAQNFFVWNHGWMNELIFFFYLLFFANNGHDKIEFF